MATTLPEDHRMRSNCVTLSVLAVAALLGAAAPSPQRSPFAPAIGKLADKLQSEYIFPNVGAEYARMLRGRLASGAYDNTTDAAEISRRVTADLQAVARDGHLRVTPTAAAPKSHAGPPPQSSPAIRETKWIAPGVAYISFGIVPDDPKTIAAINDFMRTHASAPVLIIDARQDHGGGIEGVDALFGYLYSARRVVGDMDENKAALTKDDLDSPNPPSIKQIPAANGLVRYQHTIIPNREQTALRHAKVFYLVSSRTASAGEYMASILKKTGRATIVGERTKGDNHFGFFVPLGDGLSAFIPWGRVSDPATGQDWEGKGITPDVPVAAGDALAKAVEMAGAPAGDDKAR
jgi:hypothetical protein